MVRDTSQLVARRATRILGRLPKFRQEPLSDEVNALLGSAGLKPSEKVFGFYGNDDSSMRETVFVTSLRVLIYSTGWRSAWYDEIASVPAPSKAAANGLEIIQTNGRTVFVPFRGSHGRFRDAFVLLEFLNWVKRDRANASDVGDVHEE